MDASCLYLSYHFSKSSQSPPCEIENEGLTSTTLLQQVDEDSAMLMSKPPKATKNNALGIQSYSQMMIGVSNHITDIPHHSI